MFLIDSLSYFIDLLLSSLGLRHKKGKLLLLGLDNAGKTTLLHRLRTGDDVRPFPPTDRPHQDTFQYGNIRFQAWDLGGHEAVRYLWEDYVADDVSAVLFLIDAADHERLEEAGYELQALFSDGILKQLPLAILFNKCDLQQALPTEELCQRIEYDKLANYENQIRVFRVSVQEGEGYQGAFQWIGSML